MTAIVGQPSQAPSILLEAGLLRAVVFGYRDSPTRGRRSDAAERNFLQEIR